METHKITSLTTYDKGKDGQPLKTKDGRAYTRLVIKTDKMNETQMSGFMSQATKDWKVGDEVQISVEKVAGANGAIYYNFSTPKKEDIFNTRLVALEAEVRNHKKWILEIVERMKPKDNLTSAGTKVPDFSEVDIIPDDIPF